MSNGNDSLLIAQYLHEIRPYLANLIKNAKKIKRVDNSNNDQS